MPCYQISASVCTFISVYRFLFLLPEKGLFRLANPSGVLPFQPDQCFQLGGGGDDEPIPACLIEDAVPGSVMRQAGYVKRPVAPITLGDGACLQSYWFRLIRNRRLPQTKVSKHPAARPVISVNEPPALQFHNLRVTGYVYSVLLSIAAEYLRRPVIQDLTNTRLPLP
jgi:hypothetical protein